MDRRSTESYQPGGPIPCKPAALCIEESWRELHIEGERRFPGHAVDETEAILFALAQAVEQRDQFTAGHCERLAFLAVALGVTLGLDQSDLLILYRGGFLHDIGKVGIPDAILFKPTRLTPQEWVTMKTHTTRGVEICRHLQSLQSVLPLIRSHHERWDGSGYPEGLAGERIPVLARVLQVADIYDALTSPRPYKVAFSTSRALDLLREETDKGWRDPEIMAHFFRLQKEVLQEIPGDGSSLAAMQNSLAQLV
jgi:putative two-component system response regulator